jgi:ABC-2 type transport system ATP-binding protein
VLGYDVTAAPLEVRRRIVVVIQEQAAELFLSVRDNLLTFARFHGHTGPPVRARVDDVMEKFGLTPDAARKVMDLSGGARRRVQVAKVFMVDTPVAFLDEFSTGMDPILKRSVIELLRAEARRGRTIVLTTHVLSEAEALCDDILIMDQGRQIARGDLHALKLMSEGVYHVTMTFEAVPEGLEAELAPHHPLDVRVTHNTIELSLKEDEGRVLELVGRLSSRATVLRVEIGGPSLEDIFLELTGKGRQS